MKKEIREIVQNSKGTLELSELELSALEKALEIAIEILPIYTVKSRLKPEEEVILDSLRNKIQMILKNTISKREQAVSDSIWNEYLGK